MKKKTFTNSNWFRYLTRKSDCIDPDKDTGKSKVNLFLNLQGNKQTNKYMSRSSATHKTIIKKDMGFKKASSAKLEKYW